MCKQTDLTVLFFLLGPLVCGCQTARYYNQAMVGQMQILSRERSVKAVIADPNSSQPLRERLQLVLGIRQFAQNELHLKPNGHYLQYADLHREFVVWNVHAAPEFSLEPKTWWYPVVGRLEYRGYFSETDANCYARKLENQGYDVVVGGVQAYSTLGWFRDPVLNTFIFDSETELVELLFHEMAHQRVFVRGDTDFNEAFATAVAEEGLRRWMRMKGDVQNIGKYRAALERKEQFVKLVLSTRDKLRELYGETEGGKSGSKPIRDPRFADSQKRIAKSRIFDEMRRNYDQLKAEWSDDDNYDLWFQNPLNNAKLNTVEAYYRLVPAFHHLLHMHGGDLQKLYREAKALGRLSKEQRQRRLAELFDNVEPGSQGLSDISGTVPLPR